MSKTFDNSMLKAVNSKYGMINDSKNWSLTLCDNRLFIEVLKLITCCKKVSLLSIVTPRSLNLSTTSTIIPFISKLHGKLSFSWTN
ncbi:hypothetical protein BpHYR1_013511 [Brachionus plicatilis]|uniref:Uncharacterized protein n=1 Tax=Brachionus plicatilis TaxID=10195 RepID=A0A3M7STK1_BRAPC|nr:hypothetical protein BpHYR1_013511 [Brachionus plicatilis]